MSTCRPSPGCRAGQFKEPLREHRVADAFHRAPQGLIPAVPAYDVGAPSPGTGVSSATGRRDSSLRLVWLSVPGVAV